MYNRWVLISLIVLFSCTDNNVKKKYYRSGNLQYVEYYTKNKIDSIEEYSENTGKLISKITDIHKKYRKTIYFDEESSNNSSGIEILKDGKYIRDGWWIEHNNGYTLKVEYISIGDIIEHHNQAIIIDSLDNIKYKSSNFYTISLPDTIESNKEYSFTIILNTPIKGSRDLYSSILILSDDILSDFSNYGDAKRTYNIWNIDINKWQIDHTFTREGSFYIRGFILNHVVEVEDISKDSIKIINTPNITYINKKVFIK